MVTYAKVSKAGIIPTAPRRSKADYTQVVEPSNTLEFRAEFNSKTDADKLPRDYIVGIDDPSGVLTLKDKHVDYASITEIDLRLLMRDIYLGLRRNGRKIQIKGKISVEVYD